MVFERRNYQLKTAGVRKHTLRRVRQNDAPITVVSKVSDFSLPQFYIIISSFFLLFGIKRRKVPLFSTLLRAWFEWLLRDLPALLRSLSLCLRIARSRRRSYLSLGITAYNQLTPSAFVLLLGFTFAIF